MIETESKASKAERLLTEIAPYCDQVEKDAYKALLDADRKFQAAEVPARREALIAPIKTVRELKGALRTAMVVGQQTQRKHPLVA